jgi:transposase
VRGDSLWRAVLGVDQTVIEDVWFDEEAQVVVVSVRPVARQRGRCGRCRVRCPGYDVGRGRRRRWRGLDLGTITVWLEAESPRVRCRVHGAVVAYVPWARHGAGHTRAFDDQVAWLAVHMSKIAVTQLMRIAWRTVGAIITRVNADAQAGTDGFEGLRRIGIDEVSYKRHHKYLTVVVDHDRRRLVWAAPGRGSEVLGAFFTALGPQRCAQITHVSADSARWITKAVIRACPDAVRCADPFHVVKWANQALDEARREIWNQVRTRPTHRTGSAKGPGVAIKSVRWALWKNPEDLTGNQRTELAWIAKAHPDLHRAYLLKEGLRLIFQRPPHEAITALDRWTQWARRSRIPAFVDLQRRLQSHKTQIIDAITNRLSNGLTESVNAKIRLLTRIAYGFKNPHALIALAMLNLAGHCPPLPGRL